jgi:hypothetical protein
MKEFIASVKSNSGFTTTRVFAQSAADARRKVEEKTQSPVIAVMSAKIYDEVMKDRSELNQT